MAYKNKEGQLIQSGSTGQDVNIDYFNQKNALYETGLKNVYEDYLIGKEAVKKAESQNLQDAYYIKEMSKKYLGEYGSNIGLSDLTPELANVYANYASNVSEVKQTALGQDLSLDKAYRETELQYKDSMLENTYAQKLSEYENNYDEIASILNNNQLEGTGFGSYKEFVESNADLLTKERYDQLMQSATYKDEVYVSPTFVDDLSKEITVSNNISGKEENISLSQIKNSLEMLNIEGVNYASKLYEFNNSYFVENNNVSENSDTIESEYKERTGAYAYDGATYHFSDGTYIKDGGKWHKLENVDVEDILYSNKAKQATAVKLENAVSLSEKTYSGGIKRTKSYMGTNYTNKKSAFEIDGEIYKETRSARSAENITLANGQSLWDYVKSSKHLTKNPNSVIYAFGKYYFIGDNSNRAFELEKYTKNKEVVYGKRTFYRRYF